MSKYTEESAGQIASYIEDDSYSISEICEMPDTGRKTFYEWRDAKPGSGKAIKEAKGRFEEKLGMTVTARRPLICAGSMVTERKRGGKCHFCYFFYSSPLNPIRNYRSVEKNNCRQPPTLKTDAAEA